MEARQNKINHEEDSVGCRLQLAEFFLIPSWSLNSVLSQWRSVLIVACASVCSFSRNFSFDFIGNFGLYSFGFYRISTFDEKIEKNRKFFIFDVTF